MELRDEEDGARRASGARRGRGRRTAAGLAGGLALAGWAYLAVTEPSGGDPRAARNVAPPAPAPERPAVVDPLLSSAERYAEQVVALANAERARVGCAPLRPTARLRAAAQAHADDMSARGYYEHRSPEGEDGGDRITAAGYDWRAWGENIHRGPKTPAQAMHDWMSSTTHRRNVLNCSFKDLGVGVNLRSNGPWWVQNFGAKG